MEVEAIFLGILFGLIFYEIVGLTPGGVIVPGYIALYLNRPQIVAVTFGVAIITFVIIRLLGRLVILYGRRAFVGAVIVGFLLKWIIETVTGNHGGSGTELVIIGYIIPGLIANEMRKQGVWQTLLSCLAVSIFVAIVVQIYQILQ